MTREQNRNLVLLYKYYDIFFILFIVTRILQNFARTSEHSRLSKRQSTSEPKIYSLTPIAQNKIRGSFCDSVILTSGLLRRAIQKCRNFFLKCGIAKNATFSIHLFTLPLVHVHQLLSATYYRIYFFFLFLNKSYLTC